MSAKIIPLFGDAEMTQTQFADLIRRALERANEELIAEGKEPLKAQVDPNMTNPGWVAWKIACSKHNERMNEIEQKYGTAARDYYYHRVLVIQNEPAMSDDKDQVHERALADTLERHRVQPFSSEIIEDKDEDDDDSEDDEDDDPNGWRADWELKERAWKAGRSIAAQAQFEHQQFLARLEEYERVKKEQK